MDRESLEKRYTELEEQFQKMQQNLLILRGAMAECKRLLDEISKPKVTQDG